LLDELRRHAAASAALREIALAKTAGPILRTVGKGLRAAGKFVAKRPVETALVAAGALAGVGAARSAMAGFNPAIHRAQLGIEP
jgi:hypothetical protein